MLAKVNRLTNSDLFAKIRNSGKFYQGVNFGAAYLKKDINEPSKFGFIVSNKISKSAVARNKIKRLLRNAVGENLKACQNGYDIIFLAKKSISDVTQDKLVSEVSTFFDKLNK